MSPPRVVAGETVAYVVVDGDVLTTEALAVARLVDGPSGDPLEVRGVSPVSPFVSMHVASGGWLVVTGRRDVAMPDLPLSAQVLRARVAIPGQAPLDVTITVPAGTDPLPFVAPDVAIFPLPTTLEGTVTQAAFPHAAIPGARVHVSASTAPPALLAVRTPVSNDHVTGTSVRARGLTPSAGPTSLSAPVRAGANVVSLVSTTGCAPGGVLQLGAPSLAEHVVLTTVDPIASTVTLSLPLRRSRAAGDAALAHTLGAVGATATLSAPARAGDGILSLAAALTGDVVEVVDVVPEVRAVDGLTGGDGRWRLQGARGIGRLTLEVTAPGFLPSGPRRCAVDYRRPNLVDFALKT